MIPLFDQIDLYAETIAVADVQANREGRAIRADGSRYSATSQAATDAINPESTYGGVLIAAADARRPLRIASFSQRVPIRVVVGTGGCSAGDYLRPEYAAAAVDADAFIADDTALPEAEGTYFYWGVALEDGAAGDAVLMRVDLVRVEVTA